MSGRVIFFDVIETLFSLAPLHDRFSKLGLPEQTAPLFFTQLLRDAFALSAAGRFQPFPAIARATLEVVLTNAGSPVNDDRVERILGEFSRLPAHPDVRPALERVRASADTRAILLTNGSRDNTEKLVQEAGLESLVDDIVSIEEFRVWKPMAQVYRQAAARAGVAPEQATLVAAHAWDTNGAIEAGLNAVWVRRQDTTYHALMATPRACVANLEEAVRAVLSPA
ncbi:haloacid dehalogenase type II [Microbulbifer zhoushanensis]|uniref:haloacid dehalogenase type II n=1 Tax=Microbulbifer zhoushanensis TaxID=2904254 RepID=UPI001F02A977|nr:haloacid dehalogenase type II [Microbulbifer zhoushanensis]